MVCMGLYGALGHAVKRNRVCIQSKGSAIAVALTAVLVPSGLAAGGLAATAAVGSIDSVVGQSIETSIVSHY
jgi:hypothetical protein